MDRLIRWFCQPELLSEKAQMPEFPVCTAVLVKKSEISDQFGALKRNRRARMNFVVQCPAQGVFFE